MTDWVTGDDEALAAITNLTVVLGDNKYYLGRRMSEWAAGPPTLEDSVAGASIAQQLLGQARVLFPLLEDFPTADWGVPEGDRSRDRHYNVSALDGQLPTWPHVVAALFLVNSACNVVLSSLRRANHADIAKRVTRMLEEERFQRQYAAGRVRELAERYRAGRRLLQEQITALLPEMLCWFGPDGEVGVRALKRVALVDSTNEAWRRRWLDEVVPPLEEAGIEVPVTRHSEDGWDYGELPWDNWNQLQRRLETTTNQTAKT